MEGCFRDNNFSCIRFLRDLKIVRNMNNVEILFAISLTIRRMCVNVLASHNSFRGAMLRLRVKIVYISSSTGAFTFDISVSWHCFTARCAACPGKIVQSRSICHECGSKVSDIWFPGKERDCSRREDRIRTSGTQREKGIHIAVEYVCSDSRYQIWRIFIF